MAKIKIKPKIIFLAIVLIMIIGGGIFLLIPKNKKPETPKTSEKTIVCGDDVIARANYLYGRDDLSQDKKKFISEIMSKKDYNKEADCINALYMIAVTNYELLSIDDQRKLIVDYEKTGNSKNSKFESILTIDDISRLIGGGV